MEDGDSDGDIHLDSGTDRNGNDIMYGSYDVRCEKMYKKAAHPKGGCAAFWYVGCLLVALENLGDNGAVHLL